MKRYEVFAITRLSKYIGTYEAEDQDDAINQAVEGGLYQAMGGPCHQCQGELGDPDDDDFVAFEDDPKKEES